MTNDAPAPTSPGSPSTATMTRGRTLLFAVAGGAAVGNLYWAQPLLGIIGGDLDASPASTGLLITVTQVGYALGVFFIVPLGDRVDRRRAVPLIMLLSALALAASAAAPSFPLLLVALTLVGLTTVAGQMLTPLAGDLATDADRGRVVGTVASGLILGILVSRAISGLVADALGWRAVYVVAAVLLVVLAALMARSVPSLPRRAAAPYRQLLWSVLTTVARRRQVRVSLVIGASVMAVFTMFWTGLTFLLSAEPYGWSPARIGLVSIVGVAGAVGAQRAGRLFDRGLSVPAIGVGLAVTLVSLVVAGLGGGSLVVVLIAVALLSVGIQSSQVLLQTRLLSLDPAARSRLNTAFVVGNFVGGSIGSALAGTVWPVGGWPALMVLSAVLIGVAGTVWAVHRRRGLVNAG
ncbi:MFS transporter [Frigoribacterium sp. CFBP 13707]|uniref:MFS transporter n=1 Tax=Frigoribacterium sp. CFBP 13707 TaxID=2775313 RepID=UPI003530200A